MRYSDAIRRDTAAAVANLEKVQASHRRKADELQPYIDRLYRILDDEPVDS